MHSRLKLYLFTQNTTCETWPRIIRTRLTRLRVGLTQLNSSNIEVQTRTSSVRYLLATNIKYHVRWNLVKTRKNDYPISRLPQTQPRPQNNWQYPGCVSRQREMQYSEPGYNEFPQPVAFRVWLNFGAQQSGLEITAESTISYGIIRDWGPVNWYQVGSHGI